MLRIFDIDLAQTYRFIARVKQSNVVIKLQTGVFADDLIAFASDRRANYTNSFQLDFVLVFSAPSQARAFSGEAILMLIEECVRRNVVISNDLY